MIIALRLITTTGYKPVALGANAPCQQPSDRHRRQRARPGWSPPEPVHLSLTKPPTDLMSRGGSAMAPALADEYFRLAHHDTTGKPLLHPARHQPRSGRQPCSENWSPKGRSTSGGAAVSAWTTPPRRTRSPTPRSTS